jgi:GH24 family phage-related lysozyme (muramidase)
MKTTPALISFLLHIEGFREKAYDDQQPHLDLNPGDEHLVTGRITYGSGLTTRPDGTPVQLGDTITPQENSDRVTRHVRLEVEPVLENLVHVPLWPSAYDAIGSIIYNFGREEVADWRLWGRINHGEPSRNIALEWVTGTYFDDGQPVLGLWRRRFMEILMFFGLDWRVGDNVGWKDDPIRVMEQLGWEGDAPKPEPVLESDALNAGQREKLEDFARDNGKVVVREAAPEVAKKATTLAPKKKTIHVEVPVDAEPKLMEDSKTHKGLSKAESGKEAVIVGTTVTGVTAGLPVAKELAGFFKAYDLQVLLTAGLAFGGVLLLVGAWRWWAGKQIAYEGRQQASQPKV